MLYLITINYVSVVFFLRGEQRNIVQKSPSPTLSHTDLEVDGHNIGWGSHFLGRHGGAEQRPHRTQVWCSGLCDWVEPHRERVATMGLVHDLEAENIPRVRHHATGHGGLLAGQQWGGDEWLNARHDGDCREVDPYSPGRARKGQSKNQRR